MPVDEISQQVTTAVTDFFTNPEKLSELAGGVLQVAIAIGTGLFAIVIVFILTLYFAASLNSMKRATYQLVPASKRERFADLTEQITQSVGRYVLGQASLAACNGVASFIFLSIIQAPFPAVLAFLAFLFSLVPLVGTLTGSVIIVLVCLIPGLGSPLTALVAAIYYLIYMQVEAYFLSPRIMNRAVKVPGALVVIAALAGGALLGILGALDRDPGRRGDPAHHQAGRDPAPERALTPSDGADRGGHGCRDVRRRTAATSSAAAGPPGSPPRRSPRARAASATPPPTGACRPPRRRVAAGAAPRSAPPPRRAAGSRRARG